MPRNLETYFDAKCCIVASLQCLLSARFALPSRLDGDVIGSGLRSEGSARARWELTYMTHIWLLLRLRRNAAAGAARWKVAGLASPCCIISCPLPRRTEGTRRLRDTAQIAFHFLRIGLHVGVAAPTLGQVQRRSLFPSSQLCCVEHEWRQFTVAVAALVQTLFPGIFLSISHTLRQLGRASIAFRFFCDILVPSPHIETVGVECRACQCFPADDALHFGVVVGGPASCDAMCFAQCA